MPVINSYEMKALNAAKQEFQILRVQPLRDFNASWRDVRYTLSLPPRRGIITHE
jgi:hypothetical protein